MEAWKSRIFLSKNPERLEAALGEFETYGAVETEFGGKEVKGSSEEWTLNHHINPDNDPPSLTPNLSSAPEAIGVSHFDLDTLGGVLALQGLKPSGGQFPGDDEFWDLVAWVDTTGPHRMSELGASQENEDRLAAFWAWSQENRRADELKDREADKGRVKDVTDVFRDAYSELLDILGGVSPYLELGRKLRDAEQVTAEETLIEVGDSIFGKVALRKSKGDFVNSLYVGENGEPVEVIVAFYENSGAITVSKAREDGQASELHCAEFLQALFGEGAGGHEGIAGTPRDETYKFDMAEDVFRLLKNAVEPEEVYEPILLSIFSS